MLTWQPRALQDTMLLVLTTSYHQEIKLSTMVILQSFGTGRFL